MGYLSLIGEEVEWVRVDGPEFPTLPDAYLPGEFIRAKVVGGRYSNCWLSLDGVFSLLA